MGRLARVIAIGLAHHVTQRGNGRRFLLDSDADRRAYLDLLQDNLRLHQVLLVGYCLMSNHVHLIVIPSDSEGLALSLKHTHGRYAAYWNVMHNSSGHAWQGRYYSCPLDTSHLWEALRYTELNPVRAKLVDDAACWAWSSAAVHSGALQAEPLLSMELWQTRWTHTSWREYLSGAATESELDLIRRCTHTGRPLGSAEFTAALEQLMARRLAPQKGGRPANPQPDARQISLPLGS